MQRSRIPTPTSRLAIAAIQHAQCGRPLGANCAADHGHVANDREKAARSSFRAETPLSGTGLNVATLLLHADVASVSLGPNKALAFEQTRGLAVHVDDALARAGGAELPTHFRYPKSKRKRNHRVSLRTRTSAERSPLLFR